MEIIFTNPHFHFRKWLIRNIMRTFIFLFCTTVFALTPVKTLSQNVKIEVKENKKISVDEFFDLIMQQTDYKFFYEEGIFKDLPKIELKKGVINVNELLKQSLLKANFDITIGKNNTVIIKEKPKSVNSVQQKIKVSGKVTDQAGLPLPGANVLEKGTTNGTQTDLDGKFTLSIENKDAILEFSFVGFKAKSVAVNGQSTINIILQDNASSLEEVVVVGYGTQKQRNVSGSIAKVPMNELQDVPVMNFDQALAGKLAGVQVLQTSGQPGKEMTIKVRGTGTITAGADPLYVVDGVPLESAGQSTEVVNMEDIESIQVLKDAASASIYGSRGGNGVVIITTKKGKKGKMKVDFNQSTGVQYVSKKINMMDAYQYAALSRDGHNAAYLQDVPTGNPNDPNSIRPIGYQKIPEELFPYLNGVKGLTNTDWQDAIYRPAQMYKYNVSISGGTDGLSYFVSANHSKQEGIVLNSDYAKSGFRANLGVTSGKFKIGLNVSPSYTRENRVSSDDPWSGDGIVSAALSYSPTWPVYNANGSFNYQGNGYWRNGTDYQHNEIVNPVALATLPTNIIEHYNILSDVFVEYAILNDLKFKSSLAINYNQYQNEYYRPAELETRGAAFNGLLSNPSAQLSTTNIFNWVLENTINYKKRIGEHNFDVLGGITAQKNSNKLQRIQSSVTSDTPVKNAIQVVNADQTTNSDGSLEEWSLYSLLARAQYDYSSKYLLSASMRADASSRFGSNNKWGYFPSVSAGWRISQEDFLKDVNWISELKLRSSYGLTGNYNIGNYQQAALITNDSYVTGIPGKLQTGLRPSQIANPDISWEKTTMYNIGLDVEIFKNLLGFTIEYYNANTNDLLLSVPVPLTTGFSTALQNIGKVNNKGFEATVNFNPDLGKLKWNSSFNVSVNRNEVLALGPQNTDIITTAGADTAYYITKVGKPIGSYYLLVQDGIFSTQAELNKYPHFPNTAVGDFRFVDVDGDGVLDVNKDRTIVGNYAPDFTYGFSNGFKYENFDFSIAFQGSYGGEVLNLARRYNANGEGNANNTTELLDRWQSESNPGDGDTNRANRKATGNNGRTSTFHIEDGSYLRLQNVSFGFSLPKSVIDNLKISKARFYLSANNLHTWAKYSGYNPEVNSAGGGNQLSPGLDYGVYPLATSYSLGINVSF